VENKTMMQSAGLLSHCPEAGDAFCMCHVTIQTPSDAHLLHVEIDYTLPKSTHIPHNLALNALVHLVWGVVLVAIARRRDGFRWRDEMCGWMQHCHRAIFESAHP
jgi:hypothetical protein